MQTIKFLEDLKGHHFPSPDIPIEKGIDIADALSFKTEFAHVYYSFDKKAFITVKALGISKAPANYVIEIGTLEMNDYGEDFRSFAHTIMGMSATQLKDFLIEGSRVTPNAASAA
jgi:hypothetical protein